MNNKVNYVIDAHTHVFPDKIADKSKVNVGKFYNLPMYTTGTSDELHRISGNSREINGKTYQIKYQLICSPAVTGGQTESINHFISELVRNNSDYIGFGTLHPDNENYTEIIDNIKSSGLKGVKFHSDFQRFDIDDKKMYPVYRYIAKCGLPVLFHAGDAKLDHSHPARIRKVMSDIPELKVIAAHMGGYLHWNESINLEPSENLFFDISSSLSFLSEKQFVQFIEKFGYKKFFFGSDFPMWYPYGELEKFLLFDLEEEIQKAVLFDNFAEFIGI
ncbi:MAG: amidohydrolase family protein [Porcipelethomonas sp.]